MKYVLLGIINCIATFCYSQKVELKYDFPDSVKSAILRGINVFQTDSVYIQFYKKEEGLNLLSVRGFRMYDGDLLRAVLSSCRSVDIADKRLPIMFEEDMMFEKKFRLYTIAGNGYVILFTDEGKIKEEHRSQ